MRSRILGLALAAAASFAPQAHAEATLKFQFTGTVNYSTYLASPGTKISGTFTYAIENMSPKKQMLLHGVPSANSVQYAMSPPAGITAKVGDHTISGAGLSVSVTDNFGGNLEDFISIGGGYQPGTGGGGIVLDGTTYANGVIELALGTAPGNTGVFVDTRLPRHLKVEAFDGGNSGVILVDGSSNGVILEFRIDSITEVRE